MIHLSLQKSFRTITTLLVCGCVTLTHLSATVGDIASDFQLPHFDSDEEMFRLYDQEGTILILEWFGWWCPFCPAVADALEKRVLRSLSSGNSSGIPVRHVALHVEGADTAGIQDFVNTYGFETVLMDVERTVFSRFYNVRIQPFIVILNGVKNAEGIEQWEVLYELNGFGGIDFPASKILSVIHGVKASSGGTPDPVEVIPTEAPVLEKSQPFTTLLPQFGLKNSDMDPSMTHGLGWIWDANYPYVYSFGIASQQEHLSLENAEQNGWCYIYPDQTLISGGLLLYVYATEEWIWVPGNGSREYQNLSSPSEGISGWKQFGAFVDVDVTAESVVQEMLSNLTLPTAPPVLNMGNPFQPLPAGENGRDVSVIGFDALGVVDDTSFPILKSDKLAATQTGASAGWFYMQEAISSADQALLLYLYDTEEWVWLPASQDNWGFHFNHLGNGKNGWHKGSLTSTDTPNAPALEQFANSSVPENLPEWNEGNPFADLPVTNGVKNTASSDDLKFGWIDDSRYPYVYSFLFGEDEQSVDPSAAGWLFVDDAYHDLAGGLWAFHYGESSWLWSPPGVDDRFIYLGDDAGGIGGWSSVGSISEMPNLTTRTIVGEMAVPDMVPTFGMVNPFASIPVVNELRNSESGSSMITGLGWIDDQQFPLVYSYNLAAQQTIEEVVGDMTSELPHPMAGWIYIHPQWSNQETGVLIYSYAVSEWRWYPADGNYWYFSITHFDKGDSGWQLYE